MELFFLCGLAFLAGLVDSVVGGGGLIQLPALLLFLPPDARADIPSVWGTSKVASICGTGVAVAQYSRRVHINWASILPAAATACVFALLGARTVTLIRPEVLKPIILALLVIVALHTYRRKNLGDLHAPAFTAHRERIIGVLVGAVLGFYDGFFGPGTGSFLIFIFIGLFGFDFLSASASAKVVNFATNLSPTIYFAATGRVYYEFALPMAAWQIAGSLVGTRLAMLKGNRFVRGFFLVVVSALIARFAWDVFRPR